MRIAGELRGPPLEPWDATRQAVDETGLLTGDSATVHSTTRLGHHRAVPQGFDVPWGQGPLLAATLERSREPTQG